jgi:phenylpyruvate tautomerase PptA (4-oxalocrotonate tautomerase family)
MPYLRLSSLPLDEETKRHLADELTATVLDILPDEKPEWTSVHFTPFEPGEFAIAGRLVADGAIPDTHLEISAPVVDEKSWFALRNRLTDVLIEALSIPESERWHVNVKLNRYDAHSFAVAGNASDELEQLAAEAREDDGGSRGWLRPAVVAGFVVGAIAGYRWLAARIRTDATVDAAPPLASAGATGTSGTSPANTASAAAQSAATLAANAMGTSATTDTGPRPY